MYEAVSLGSWDLMYETWDLSLLWVFPSVFLHFFVFFSERLTVTNTFTNVFFRRSTVTKKHFPIGQSKDAEVDAIPRMLQRKL